MVLLIKFLSETRVFLQHKISTFPYNMMFLVLAAADISLKIGKKLSEKMSKKIGILYFQQNDLYFTLRFGGWI